MTVVKIFGPFATPIGVIGRLGRYIEEHWLGAQSQLDAQFSSQSGIENFLHFGMTVTLRDSLTEVNHVLNVEVIREDNDEVKQVIPMQPVWTVVCTEMRHHAIEKPSLRAREVLRSFPPTETGGREAKALARSTAEAKLTSGNTTIARMIWDSTGVLGVNNIYHIVGTSMGWSVEAIFHDGPDIEFETASDENGHRLDGAVLNPVLLAQQHMEQQG